jgi:hypothetical protein
MYLKLKKYFFNVFLTIKVPYQAEDRLRQGKFT